MSSRSRPARPTRPLFASPPSQETRRGTSSSPPSCPWRQRTPATTLQLCRGRSRGSTTSLIYKPSTTARRFSLGKRSRSAIRTRTFRITTEGRLCGYSAARTTTRSLSGRRCVCSVSPSAT
eukprot:Amastigsp_a18133_5.p2 type:complete len:121 gc:universal Amastigsp_a18133_5:251-613(+)